MIEFANFPAAERELYFQQTAELAGLPAHLVEKDFWVCFTLQQLFGTSELAKYLTFKGGTSLSKVFKAIDRFSEDIDFAVSRDCLGFGDQGAPDLPGISMEERKRRLANLTKACLDWTKGDLFPTLHSHLSRSLGNSAWNAELVEDQNNNQQIFFHYPQSGVTQGTSYNPPRVRIELTARTDNHPAMNASVSPIVAEQFPDAVDNPQAQVEVLRVERTFWEKATILHQFHFQNDSASVTAGFSRHYYDIHQLVTRGFSGKAIEEIALLTEVADHKDTYYRQRWARYDLARNPTTLELLPHTAIESTIAADYIEMREMIFGELPTFDEILQVLRYLQSQINTMH
ncbi:MAG: nucleotidyl transferase AbiEii/AbiGii toxin family protein [Planctomycetales bacterium]|nr:nucleotidyl transferase AbiEii/AbiGii toxin family protein [Planctomycetales bacterium]